MRQWVERGLRLVGELLFTHPVRWHTVANPVEEPVRFTMTGEGYHKGTCGTSRKSKIAKTLSEAKAMGYTPCGLCKPPR